VHEIPGARWELALDLIRDGGQEVFIPGPVPISLWRSTGPPAADGRIHVCICTSFSPRSISIEMAQQDATSGLQTLRRAEAGDPRLTHLLEEYVVVYEYVSDYGTGAVKLGDVEPDGQVRLT
jgi:hypothetical protein